MPELEAVQKQKTAGFVDTQYRSKRQEKIAQEEKELEELIQAQSNSEKDEEEEKVEAKTQEVEEAKEEEELTSEEKTWKKRYADLRRHQTKEVKALKEEIEKLKSTTASTDFKPPASNEDVDQWMDKYPDVAKIVESIALKKAKELFDKADTKMDELTKAQKEAERIRGESKIRKAHSDFDDIISEDEFHDWVEEQPKWVNDAAYSDDAASVIRVLDLYKSDKGLTKKDQKDSEKKAASAVKSGTKTVPEKDEADGYMKESQIAKMSMKEYEKNEDKINAAIRSGKFIYDISGSAR